MRAILKSEPFYQMPIKDKKFFIKLGKRITQMRKAQSLTQIDMAKMLNIGQQTYANYETGVRRLPSSLLPALSKIYGVSVEEILGLSAKASKPGPTPKLKQKFDTISKLPKKEQQFFIQMLDRFLNEAKAS